MLSAIFDGINSLMQGMSNRSNQAGEIAARNEERQNNQRNFEFMNKAYESQEQWNQKGWDRDESRYQQMMTREDNAMQRKVADMKAAGLSPVLAAGGSGSGASSMTVSTPRVGSSPKMESPTTIPHLEKTRIALDAMTQEANIGQSQAQQSLIKVQEAKALQEAELLGKQTKMADIQAKVLEASAGLSEEQLEEFRFKKSKYRDLGLPMDATGQTKTFAPIIDTLMEQLQPEIEKRKKVSIMAQQAQQMLEKHKKKYHPNKK